MTDSVYSFRAGPTYRGATRQELFDSAMEQPLSLSSTFFDQAKGGILESYGLGTAVREFAIPDGEPTPESNLRTARRLLNPLTAGYETTRMAVQAFREDSPVLEEEKYKTSPWYRENIPWDAGMTEARAKALAEWNDAKTVRQFYAEKRPITAFLGNLTGQAFDPINYVPVGGPLVRTAAMAKAGRVGGSVITGAVDAATNTALAGLATREARARFGDDVSFQAMVSEIATAALIGSAFGGIAGALDARAATRAVAEAQRSLATLKTTQEARIALNEAIDAVVRGEDVRLTPNATEAAARVASEMEGIARAYDAVRESPTGPVDDPLVRITPEDIEGTIVARGAFKDVNEVEFSRRGWGLVKIIWRHGEEGAAPEALQVRKDDVVDLPRVVRSYEPSSVSADGRQREWRVERDGRVVVYADSVIGDDRHLVTAYVQNPEHVDASRALSEKRKPAAARSPSDALNALGDTDQVLSLRGPDGRPLPASQSITQTRPASKVPEGRPQAEARIAKPDDYKALTEQYRVDPETGDFPELVEIEQMRASGKLTDEDLAELDAAQAVLDDANAYGEALKTVVGCLL